MADLGFRLQTLRYTCFNRNRSWRTFWQDYSLLWAFLVVCKPHKERYCSSNCLEFCILDLYAKPYQYYYRKKAWSFFMPSYNLDANMYILSRYAWQKSTSWFAQVSSFSLVYCIFSQVYNSKQHEMHVQHFKNFSMAVTLQLDCWQSFSFLGFNSMSCLQLSPVQK